MPERTATLASWFMPGANAPACMIAILLPAGSATDGRASVMAR